MTDRSASPVRWDRIEDWDAAYANAAYIRDGDSYPGRWAAAAERFRRQRVAAGRVDLDRAYGGGARQKLDFFFPDGPAKGLLIFLHGGYWMAFDKASWSHFAGGAVGLGWAVAIPSYRLCPSVGLPDIVEDAVAAAATAAEIVPDGPIHLAGHSAGGHLVTRLVATDTGLPPAVLRRIGRVCSISGVHDLRPLSLTRMAGPLGLTPALAVAQSPALSMPVPGTHLVAWVGADERPEFRRQSALMASAWMGCGATTALVEMPNRHHFSVLDDMPEPTGSLARTLCALDDGSALY